MRRSSASPSTTINPGCDAIAACIFAGGLIAVTDSATAAIAQKDGYQTRMAPVSAKNLELSLSQAQDWARTLSRPAADSINSIAIDWLNSRIVLDVANSPVGAALNLPTLIAQIQVMVSPGGGGPLDRAAVGALAHRDDDQHLVLAAAEGAERGPPDRFSETGQLWGNPRSPPSFLIESADGQHPEPAVRVHARHLARPLPGARPSLIDPSGKLAPVPAIVQSTFPCKSRYTGL